MSAADARADSEGTDEDEPSDLSAAGSDESDESEHNDATGPDELDTATPGDEPAASDEDAAAHPQPDQSEGAAPGSGDLPNTGDEAVDRALEDLPGIAAADPAEQLDTYVGVHRALQDRLADSGV